MKEKNSHVSECDGLGQKNVFLKSTMIRLYHCASSVFKTPQVRALLSRQEAQTVGEMQI